MRIFLLLSLAAALSPSRALAAALLFAAGSDQSFDTSLPTLSYAASDASQFAAAMKSVGMAPRDTTLLSINPTRDEFLAGLEQIRRKVAEAGEEAARKFIFYWSGHSDERGLHLRDALFAKEELHAFLAKLAVRTKVVILDSCYAGAIAIKGVRPIETMLPLKFTVDEPSGSIFLTATSARDVAVESRTMRGSLFTHNLISGLFGGADANTDGVVTATELYEYAYRETQLASYLLPTGSPQRPELVADLKGRGAVTLAFPAGKTGSLQLLADLGGTVSVQSLQGVTSLELSKARGRDVDLPLPPGMYRLLVRDGRSIGSADVNVGLGAGTRLASNQLTWRHAAMATDIKGPQLSATTHAPPPERDFSAFLASTAFPSYGDDPARDEGTAVDLSISRSRAPGSMFASQLALNYRANRKNADERGETSEHRLAAYLGGLMRPLRAERHVVSVALDLGIGLGVSRITRQAGGWHDRSDAVDDLDRYAAARIGLRFGLLTDRIWLGGFRELCLRDQSGQAAHPNTPSSWDSIGLGMTL